MEGIQLVSKNANLFLTADSYPLLYWGYFNVSFTNGEIPLLSYKYQRILNMPTTAELTIAVRTLSASNPVGTTGAYIFPIKRTDGWNIAISGENPTFSARVYVFVRASQVPLPRYGVLVNGTDGLPVFHTGRPIMAYKELFYSDVVENGFSQQGVLVNYKPATVVWSPKVNHYSNGYMRYYNSAYGTSGNYRVGMTRVFVRAAPYKFELINRYYFPSLDAGYYEQFPNLGNYS